jgi:hypothetical protein
MRDSAFPRCVRSALLIPSLNCVSPIHNSPKPTGEIGTVASSSVKDLQAVEVGQAQAWYYPQDHSLVLWECFLETPFRNPVLLADQLHKLVWQGFEQHLRKEVPEVQRIYTTFEPIYDRPVWAKFLKTQGYKKIDKVAFVKKIGSTD